LIPHLTLWLPGILILITAIIVWFTLVPFISFLGKQQQLSNGTAVPFPPLPMPQLQKQEQALEKNMSEHPCTGGGINPRPGVLCPEDNNMTKLFHTANNTV
jgi:hypothetical protein